MAITAEMRGMPPKWMVYFSVKNSDETVKQVKALGGTVYKEMKISVGKMAIISDPAGAGFMTMESSTPPEEWIE